MFPFISDWLPGTLEHLLFKPPLQKRPKGRERKGRLSAVHRLPYNFHEKRERSCDVALLNGPGGMWFHCPQQHHHQHSSALLLLNILPYLTTGHHSQQCKELHVIFKRHWQKLDDGAGCITYTFAQLHNADQIELEERQSRPHSTCLSSVFYE